MSGPLRVSSVQDLSMYRVLYPQTTVCSYAVSLAAGSDYAAAVETGS